MLNLSEYNSNTLKYVLNELPQMIVVQIELIIFSLFLAIVIGVPLGILATKTKWGRKIIVPIANLLQTIPSLALFSLLVPIPFFGVGLKNAVFVLFLYALMPIVYNTFLGLNQIDPDVINAADGIGLSRKEKLFKVELPLALPLIMSGIRIAAVLNVATSIIAAKIGAGGLGKLIFDGIDEIESSSIKLVVGSIVAIILALVVDKLFRYFEKALRERGNQFKAKRRMAQVLVVIILLIPTVLLSLNLTVNSPDIKIWSSGFAEQDIMAELSKQMIENKTDYIAEINELGSSSLLYTETKTSKEPSIYTTYTGTLYQSIYKHTDRVSTEEIYNTSKEDLNNENLDMTKSIGFNNTYTISMPREIAEENNIKEISDLKDHPNEFSIAATLESLDRDDGLKGAIEEYDLEFKEEQGLELGLRYVAIGNGEVQAIDAFATDPQIVQYDLTVLEDDRDFFLPYDSVYVFNNPLKELPEAVDAIKELEGKITDSEMQEMNYQVTVLGKAAETVAEEFLVSENLIPRR